MSVTIEEWLRCAIKHMDSIIFEGELHSDTHGYQIYFGRTKGKRGAETVQPSDAEMVSLDDFFPTTIGIDWQTGDVNKMLANLALECIRAFMGLTKGKAYKKRCESYYFDKPFTEAHPSPYLADQLADVRRAVEKELGEFPGKAIKFPTKEPKEKKPTRAVYFCPTCGYEVQASARMFKKFGQFCPTCGCGSKMGMACEDTDNEGV